MPRISQMRWLVETRANHLPFDMAVEQPDSRVVTAESQNHITIRLDQYSVASHWNGGRHGSLFDCVTSSILFRAFDDLECMAVEMEWMFLQQSELSEKNRCDIILHRHCC